jgi:hypothetical protein
MAYGADVARRALESTGDEYLRSSAYWETEAKTRRPESLLVSYRR